MEAVNQEKFFLIFVYERMAKSMYNCWVVTSLPADGSSTGLQYHPQLSSTTNISDSMHYTWKTTLQRNIHLFSWRHMSLEVN